MKMIWRIAFPTVLAGFWLLQWMLPVVVLAASEGRVQPLTICTAQGIAQVAVDANGQPLPANDQTRPHCPLCLMSHAAPAVLPEQVALGAPTPALLAKINGHDATHRAAYHAAYSLAQPRSPPFIVA